MSPVGLGWGVVFVVVVVGRLGHVDVGRVVVVVLAVVVVVGWRVVSPETVVMEMVRRGDEEGLGCCA